MAVRAARTHLRAIRWQPTHSQPFPHTHFDKQLPQQQHALSPEACNFDLYVFEVMRVLQSFLRLRFRTDFEHIGYWPLRWLVTRRNVRAAIAEDIQRKG